MHLFELCKECVQNSETGFWNPQGKAIWLTRFSPDWKNWDLSSARKLSRLDYYDWLLKLTNLFMATWIFLRCVSRMFLWFFWFWFCHMEWLWCIKRRHQISAYYLRSGRWLRSYICWIFSIFCSLHPFSNNPANAKLHIHTRHSSVHSTQRYFLHWH